MTSTDSITAELIPYVGPRPFERKHRDRFFGRDREANEIVSLIIANTTLLLYAESGTGKSSLLNAAVIPLLEHEGYEVLPPARVKGRIPDNMDFKDVGNAYTLNTLISWSDRNAEPRDLASMRLTDFLQTRERQRDSEGFEKSRVIIFDQFEEVFTSYGERPKDREVFFKQIGDVLSNDSQLHVVFAMREDYIAQLDSYSRWIPDKFRVRFRLEHLRPPAALAAVVGPLTRSHVSLRSFAPGVAEQLVEDLRTTRVETVNGTMTTVPGEFVEPVQLQVVCESLWRGLPIEVPIITQHHLEQFGNVDQALQRFYEINIADAAKHTGVTEADLRIWFEEKMVTSAGTRNMVYREQTNTGGIPNLTIGFLEDRHLIRAETKAGGRWYELTHDRFIEPIQKSNEVWRESLAAATEKTLKQETLVLKEQAVELKEQAAELEKQAASRLRLLVLALAAGLIVAIVGIFAINNQAGIARESAATSVANAILAQNNAATATVAKGQAEQNLATATVAQGQAQNNAATAQIALKEAATSAGDAFRARETALYQAYSEATQAKLARESAITATLAQGEAINNAATSDANAATAIVAQVQAVNSAATSDANAALALNNAATATLAQGQAINNAATSDANAALALNNAATATVAQGQAVNNAATSDANAATATVAQGQAINSAATAMVAQAQALNNAATAIVAQGQAEQNLATATVAKGQAELQATYAAVAANQSLALSVANSSQVALDNGQYDLALALAQEAYNVNSGLFEVRRALANAAYAPGTVRRFTCSGDSNLTCSKFSALAFSPDGRIFVSGTAEHGLILWDTESSSQIREFTGHQSAVFSVAFSPDGKYILSAGYKELFLWDVETGEEIDHIVEFEDWITSIAFSTDSKLAAVGTRDNTLSIWDIETGKKVIDLEGHTGSVTGVAFYPDGTKLISGSRDNTIRTWDIETGKESRKQIKFADTLSGVQSLAMSRDGKLFVAANGNNAFIFNAEDGSYIRLLIGHLDAINVVTFSPDGQTIATGSRDNRIITWNSNNGRQIRLLKEHEAAIHALAFSPNNRYLLSGADDGSMRLWWSIDSADKDNLQISCGCPIHAIGFSPDGYTALAAVHSEVQMWDVQTSTFVTSFKGHEADITSLAFSSDGHLALSGGKDNVVILWNMQNHKEVWRFNGHTDEVSTVAFSPDGRYALSGSSDNVVIISDIETGDEVRRFSEHSQRVNAVTVSPDSKYALSGSFDGDVRLWEIETGRPIRTLQSDAGGVNSVAFSPDGNTALAGYVNKVMILWNIQTGAEIRRFTGHEKDVLSVAYSPDGHSALSGSADNTLKLWSIDNGQLIRAFQGHIQSITGVAFSADGKSVLSGSLDSKLRLWRVDRTDTELLEWIQGNRYQRDLTCIEKDEYRTGDTCDAETYYLQGYELYTKSLFSQALTIFNKAIDLKTPDYDYYDILSWRGFTHERLNNYTLAIADFTSAITLKPESADAYTYRGYALQNINDMQAAEADFKQVITLDSSNINAYINLGEIERINRRYDVALEYLDKALQLNPEHDSEVLIYAIQGNIYIEQERFQDAVDILNKAVALDTNEEVTGLRLHRAAAYVGLNEYDLAKKDFQKWVVLHLDEDKQIPEELTSGEPKRLEMISRRSYWIEFSAEEGDHLTVQSNRLSESVVDSLIIILDSDGVPIFINDDSSRSYDSLIEGVIPADGSYTLVITHAGGGDTGSINVILDLS